MAGICNLVNQAANGLQSGAASNVFATAANALNAIAAADIAIRIGTGNQAGLGDLPGIFTQERGIECYSPELGDVIYVSPLQWYANGMSCDGLRDPNREEIERQIRELQARSRARIESGIPNLPPYVQFPPNMPRLPPHQGNFSDGRQELNFDKPGILTIKRQIIEAWVSNSVYHPVIGQPGVISYGNPYYFASPEFTREISIQPGTKIKYESYTSTIMVGFPADLPDYYLQTIVGITYPWGQKEYVSESRIRHLTGAYNWGGERIFTYSQVASRTVDTVDFQFRLLDNASPPLILGGPPINPNPNPPRDPEENCDMGCSCRDISNSLRQQNQNLNRLIQEIHKAVAASLFATGAYPLSPEQRIEAAGGKLYNQSPGRTGVISTGNLLEAINALIAAHYYRSGLHKLPAKMPDSLIPKTNQALELVDRDEIEYHDALSIQEQIIKYIDELIGQYPIEFEVKDTDQNGNVKTEKVRLWNTAEALAEIFGLNLKIAEDADLAVQLALRAMTEASKAGNAALQAVDYARANAEYLGYRGEAEPRTVKASFTPGKEKPEEMLNASEQTIIGWKYVDKEDLAGILKMILFNSHVARAALFKPLKPNPATGKPDLPGTNLKQQRENNKKDDKEWEEWKKKFQNPEGQQNIDNNIKPDIKDITPPKKS